MIAVLASALILVVLLMLYFHTSKNVPEFFNTCPKEEVVYAVLLAMYDVATSPIVNKSDVHVVYSVWGSQMIKRGAPEQYINPEFFSSVYNLQRSGQLSTTSVSVLLTDTGKPAASC